MGMDWQGAGDGPSPGVTFSATWDMLRTQTVDIGNGVDLPAAFTATFAIENDHTVSMDIAVEDGAPVCNALRVNRAEGRPSLSGHELRRFPLAEWVSFACSMVGFANQGGIRTTDAKWASEEYRAAVEGVVRQARRRNRRATPEFLRDVARVYRAAESAPVEAVRETFGPMGHSTAARYVKLARDEGLLPRTTQGKSSKGDDGGR
jgi:hypothetical protein